MPENLTTFRITAVASARLVDGESPGRFGKGDARTTVTAPLVVRAALPRQLRPGDGGELAAIVQNNTGAAGRVEVTAKVVEKPGSQGQVLKLMSSGTASAELPDGGQVRLPFRVQAQVPGAPEFELQAAFTPAGGGAPVHDGVRVPLPVEAERTLTERVAAYGTVTDDTPVAIPVKIPRDVLPGYGGVTIATSSSLLGGLEDAVHALVTYPYGCVEQTSSRLLPLIALGDLLKTYPLGIDDPRAFVAAGVERLLAMQTREGGFAYWPGGDEVHVYASAYATWVLHLAAKAGYPVPEDALARAIADLERRVAGTSFANVAVDWGYEAGVRLAIALHVLADAGRDVAGPAAELYARRQSLPLFGRAFLLMAMHRGSPRAPEVAALAGELRGNLRELPATAHTSEAPRWDLGGYFSSDGRSDAIVLMALLRAEPDHPVVVKLARGLLERRIGGAWRNTQENAYALVALTDYARAYESETPDFTARAWVGPHNVLDVAFSGREFATRAATTDMVRLVGLSQGTGATDPLPVVLQRQGTGRLYYRLGAEWAPAAADLPARAQGLTVARALRTRAGPARDAVTAGEPAALDITVTSDTRVRYVVVDVPLPAGLEAVSRTLGSGRRAAVLSGHRGWWVTHEEQRPGRVVVFADDLPPGTHVHTIDLRATTRGSYAFPPTHAEAMYMPEVYGRTIGGALEVR
jgi:alpha-2-macroglobulin